MVKLVSRLLCLLAVMMTVSVAQTDASTTYDQVFASPTTIKCNSDASCAILDHIRVQAVTYGGNAGSGAYTWTGTCASSPDAVFYIRPTGASLGCFQMDGFMASSTPGTFALPSAEIPVGNASNVAVARAMTGDVAIDNTGSTTVNTVLGGSTPVTTSRAVNTGPCLTGGGNLSADRTIDISAPLSTACGGTGSTSAVVYQPVASVSALQALATPSAIAHVFLQCYYSTGTCGGSGNFDYIATAYSSDGNCNVIQASDGNEWVRRGYNLAHYPVTNCGVVADGATNQSSRLQSAITMANALGGATLDFPGSASCYSVQATITITSNVSFYGSNQASICASGLSGATYFNLNGSNITWDGVNATYTTSGTGDHLIGCTASSTISNIHIKNSTFNGANGGTVDIDACTVTDFYSTNNFYNQVHYGLLFGSSLTNSARVSSIGDHFYHNSGDSIENNTHGNLDGFTISGDTFDNSDSPTTATNSAGFCIGVSGGVDTVITGNTFIGCHLEDIHVENGSIGTNIGSNTINQTADNCAINFPDATSAEVAHVHDNIINAPANSTNPAICMPSAGQDSVSITNNRIRNWAAGSGNPASTFTASISGQTMTVTAGSVSVGESFTGTSIPTRSTSGYSNTKIIASLGGGQYTINYNLGTIGSETMTPISSDAIDVSGAAEVSGNRISGGANNQYASGMEFLDRWTYPSVHDNTFDGYYTVYKMASGSNGGQVGRTNLVNNMPTAMLSAGTSGPFSIEGLSASYTFSHPGGGAATTTPIPGPYEYIGLVDYSCFNGSNSANRIHIMSWHVFDDTTDYGGTTAGQTYISSASTYTALGQLIGHNSTFTGAKLDISSSAVTAGFTSTPAVTAKCNIYMSGVYNVN